MVVAYVPLASSADMHDGPFKYALQGASNSYLTSTMLRASRNVESRCRRRLTPFVGLVQTEIAEGVMSVGGGVGGDVPMSMTSSLAMSMSRAYGGGNNMVRDVWLANFAPEWSDLWTYSDVSALVVPPFGGGGQTVAAVQGPRPDTGHLRLPLGVYCPRGSTIAVTYSGGYTLGTPDDLVQAAMMQATKLFILGIAPERRAGLTALGDLEQEICNLLVPYGGDPPGKGGRQ